MTFTPLESCRACGHSEVLAVLDLGSQPLANAFRAPGDRSPEVRYPLAIAMCASCSLVQLTGSVDPKLLFDHYRYFSSMSDTMVDVQRRLADRIIESHKLVPGARVVDVASNDGYLLRSYAARGMSVLGVDPAANVAAEAIASGVPTVVDYFRSELAQSLASESGQAAVIHANNVIAHVPEINDFVDGLRVLLDPAGTLVIETPSILSLVENLAFDTIYHEHVFYYSLHALARLLERHGLTVVQVEELEIHGGSIRVFARHAPSSASSSVGRLLARERDLGVTDWAFYDVLANRVERVGKKLMAMLAKRRNADGPLGAYGAAAKGTVLLNHFGIGAELVAFVADRSPHKQGLLMPGVGIPIVPTGALVEQRPNATLLLAWNFKEEIMLQQQPYLDAGGTFIVPLPEPRLVTR